MPFRVAVARCPDYGRHQVDAAMLGLWEALGGLPEPTAAGTAFVKPNLLMPRAPEDAVTTHPSVVAAVARSLAARGFQVSIGDSPGGPFTAAALRKLYDHTGMAAAAGESGAQLCFDTGSELVEARDAVVPRKYVLSSAMIRAGMLVNVCKLKTHGLTGVTAAVKNLFGCVAGLHKTEYHMTQPTVQAFSEMLVDLARHLAPALSVCDAVVSMEGAGPSHGTPRPTGLLLASRDPFALDYAIARLLGVGPDGFATLAAQLRRGYGPQSDDQLELVLAGEAPCRRLAGPAAAGWLASVRPAGFNLLRPEDLSSLQGRGRTRAILRTIQPLLRSRPAFRAPPCDRCGACVRACPAKCLRLGRRHPEVQLGQCIRCYCCQELCPRGAVSIRRPSLARLLYRHR